MMNQETILQFGTGRFLRGFFDFFIDGLNRGGLYDGKIVVVQSTGGDTAGRMNVQQGRYHLLVRGIDRGQVVEECREISAISRAICAEGDFEELLRLTESPQLQVIVSNTTEVGIRFDEAASPEDRPPASFPAKLCLLLYRRFSRGLPGLLILPCELIDRNADTLREIVLRHARAWGYGADFCRWINEDNHFCNTLVDRICTGCPAGEREALPEELRQDKLLDVVEPFHLWAIEGDFEEVLPLRAGGFQVVWTGDITPYKLRKVRILNGGHTSMVLAALLAGKETVLECMQDETIRRLFRQCVFREIVPALGEEPETIAFAQSVEERFSNPFLRHRLTDIAVNSVSKFRVRVLPTIREYQKKFERLPEGLLFSLAALLAYYRLRQPEDQPEYLRVLQSGTPEEILADASVWGEDLSDCCGTVRPYYDLMLRGKVDKAYQRVLAAAGNREMFE